MLSLGNIKRHSKTYFELLETIARVRNIDREGKVSNRGGEQHFLFIFKGAMKKFVKKIPKKVEHWVKLSFLRLFLGSSFCSGNWRQWYLNCYC